MKTTTIKATQMTHVGDWKYATEASTLGFAVGEWPREFRVEDDRRADGEFGNGLGFTQVRRDRSPDGDLVGIVYRQNLGTVEVTIYND